MYDGGFSPAVTLNVGNGAAQIGTAERGWGEVERGVGGGGEGGVVGVGGKHYRHRVVWSGSVFISGRACVSQQAVSARPQ